MNTPIYRQYTERVSRRVKGRGVISSFMQTARSSVTTEDAETLLHLFPIHLSEASSVCTALGANSSPDVSLYFVRGSFSPHDRGPLAQMFAHSTETSGLCVRPHVTFCLCVPTCVTVCLFGCFAPLPPSTHHT